MPSVVTANTLATGRVVFLAGDGAWVEAIETARLFEDADAAEDGMAMAQGDVQKAIVVEPFVANVVGEQSGRPTMSLRDAIRAYGPTIKFQRGGGDGPTKSA